VKDWLIDMLASPVDGSDLTLHVDEQRGTEIESGTLTDSSGTDYPIVNGIPRFVDVSYAGGFGIQWTRHRTTQIDTAAHLHSRQRFGEETAFKPDDLRGALVFDAGCGAGRFARVAVDAGARVVAVDLSGAVDGARSNFSPGDDISFIQGDLFALPFKARLFDYVYTIGVIQHTPDPLLALTSLLQMTKSPGGRAAASWYKRYWYTYFHQKYLLRPLFSRLPDETLYRLVSWYVPKLLPLSRALVKRFPSLQKGALIDRIVPVAFRDGVGKLTPDEQLDWAILDTFDWYSPAYDKPQRWKDVEAVFRSLDFDTQRLGRLAVVGTRR